MRTASLLLAVITSAAAAGAALGQSPSYNVGRTPTPQEIRAWDIAVGPEGKELPSGSGTARAGVDIYITKCAACHGDQLQGGGNGRRALTGGQGTMTTLHIKRSIGSYWPFATTIFDFISRAMPPRQGGSLSPDEVYALTAFLLYKNDIIGEDEVMDAKSLPKVQMPNRNNFIPHWPEWDKEAVRKYGLYP